MNYYYANFITDFVREPVDSVLGKLASRSTFDLKQTERDAWIEEIEILANALKPYLGHVFLEFTIPRLGRRLDAVVIIGHVVFLIEFKVGKNHFNRADLDQVFDYALDLKHFHRPSHMALLAPVLVATKAKDYANGLVFGPHRDRILEPLRSSTAQLSSIIEEVVEMTDGHQIDPIAWASGDYSPTPTIIEAAKALYTRHSVEEISRHDAQAKNLTVTSQKVCEIIENSRDKREKSIILVTGVPGAGKTLVGLNIATQYLDASNDYQAVYLSGNGPLVSVLREALTRDAVERKNALGEPTRRKDEQRYIEAFIQNVHHFRKYYSQNPSSVPNCHVALFDEAQRAWDGEKTAKFMKAKDQVWSKNMSESEFLISCMDRHHDWAVVVCLVGEGQEIHEGEAGIEAWVEAIATRFNHWKAYVSPGLSQSRFLQQRDILKKVQAVETEDLHLSVSLRSFRSEHVASFVKSLLDGHESEARSFQRTLTDYPIVLTRDLPAAKKWLEMQARGNDRTGILVSSGARRLKPLGIHVKAPIEPVHWFLGDKDDVRSSFFLEDVATEFDVQGLEVDWACVLWDADLRMTDFGWEFWNFKGSKWLTVRQSSRRTYLLNSYRVLLTRARKGMVIVVPKGEINDQTRSPSFYDSTYTYLEGLGLSYLDDSESESTPAERGAFQRERRH